MPQYVCLDFNTFVCTACSGIHREFAHRVKSISMSKFTESEVENMIKYGGNTAAQKFWRNKHDPSFRPTGGSDGERTRNFIRMTYIDRKWVYGSPKQSEDQSLRRTSTKSVKKNEKKNDGDGDLFNFNSNVPETTDFADFSNFEKGSKTATIEAQFLGDFATFDSPASTVKTDDDFAHFGDFAEFNSSAQKSTSKTTSSASASKFGLFTIAPPPNSTYTSSSVSTPSITNDLMGLSPPQKNNDNHFDSQARVSEPISQRHLVSAASSSIKACNDVVPTSQAASLLNTVAILSAPAEQLSSPFVALDSNKASSTSVFDAFAVSSPAPNEGSNVFDAFGNGADVFENFTGPNSSSRPNSANPPDSFFEKNDIPFANPVADPFAAFNGMQSNCGAYPGINNGASTVNFGAPGGNLCQQSAAIYGQIGYASGTTGNSSGQMPAQHHRPAYSAMIQGQNAFPAGYSQQQQPSNLIGSRTQQQPFYHGTPQQHGFSAQNKSLCTIGQQFSGQPPPRSAEPTPPVSVDSMDDPFASLSINNLGYGSSKSHPALARTGSECAMSNHAGSSALQWKPPASPMHSMSYSNAQHQSLGLSPPTVPLPNSLAQSYPDTFGDFTSAPATSQTQASTTNPFDLF
ncbi:uncharacterized protein CCR75_000223 [Bremia lactucae]|uniref:Arf-GAP domain-containing protein n=1 Tax=Bremia lactucae TaxID=4779 RepID=A0A976IAU2_BRELC|nr:hypothetical protein CCR75_000223 [Bremia lactucae]